MSRVSLFVVAILLLCSPVFSQPLGNAFIAGTTWMDMQHSGSCGRMIATDDLNDVHIVWTRGFSSSLPTRHVYYNLWISEAESFLYDSTGTQVDDANRAGYVTLAVTPFGCPHPAFHTLNEVYQHTGVSYCLEGYSQIPYPVEHGQDVTIIWPQVAADTDGILHVISMESIIHPAHPRVYYSRGVPQYDGDGFLLGIQWDTLEANSGFRVLDSAEVLGHTVAASRVTPRVALGWLKFVADSGLSTSQYNNNVLLQLSEDGGLNWQPKLNITQFVTEDTLRAYTDLSLLFTPDNILHAAFSTVGYYEASGTVNLSAGLIWHWNEVSEQFSLIADGWVLVPSPGAYQTIVQRPSLAVDESTGYLYCAYMRYDTSSYSEGGYPNADIWISVSTDNGMSWSQGTNVTRTSPPTPVPVDSGMSEREPTLAEVVTNGYLYLSYTLDKDAGCSYYDEGVTTLNPIFYQRIPVDSIPTTPLMRRYPLHHDSSGYYAVSHHEIPIPKSIQLAAYPNPFNSTTRISFSLPTNTKAELKVYDVLGRMVETLMTGSTTAGEHSLTWDASKQASGLYFVALQTPEQKRVQKVILIK